MTYTVPMRRASPAGIVILASLPLLVLVPGLFALVGSEQDIAWFFRVHKSEHDLARELAFAVTNWANPAMYAAWAGILAFGYKRRDKDLLRFALWFLAMQLAVNFLVLTGVKIFVGRPRPMAQTLVGQFMTFNPHFHSLPSGHTAEFTASALALALWLRRRLPAFFLGLCAAVVGFSRIYLCEHYPSDVFFGWCFGVFTACAAYAFSISKEPRANERTNG